MRRLLLACCVLLLLSACTPEQAPDETRRPDPQAGATPAAAPAADTTSPITATANGYKDAARNAVNQTQDATAREQSQIDQAQQ